MGRQDWLDLAYWTCVAGVIVTFILLAHVVGILLVKLTFG